MTLSIRLLRSSLVGLLLLLATVFIPAGTLAYWQGWLFIVVFTASTTVINLYLVLNDPALLERRMKVGPMAETRFLQKALIALAIAGFFALIVASVLDHRIGQVHTPVWLSIVGSVLIALGLMITLRVLQENSYAAATIQRIEGQRVISTGPYAVIRHPMYGGVVVMLLGTPLTLGSYRGLLLIFALILILVLRILDEEKLLRRELDGYDAYARQVRYRLIPGVW